MRGFEDKEDRTWRTGNGWRNTRKGEIGKCANRRSEPGDIKEKIRRQRNQTALLMVTRQKSFSKKGKATREARRGRAADAEGIWREGKVHSSPRSAKHRVLAQSRMLGRRDWGRVRACGREPGRERMFGGIGCFCCCAGFDAEAQASHQTQQQQGAQRESE